MQRATAAGAIATFCLAFAPHADGSPDGVARALADAFGRSRVILLGERHREASSHALFVELARELARRGDRLLVALEVPADRAGDLGEALAGRPTPPFPVVDGRTYRGLLADLGRLRGGGVAVAGIDAGGAVRASRDAAMAEAVREALQEGGYDRVLALVGNLHVLKAIPWSREPPGGAARKLAARLEGEGLSVASVVQAFPEGCGGSGAPALHRAGEPAVDRAVEALWDVLNTRFARRGPPSAAVDGAVVWGCPGGS